MGSDLSVVNAARVSFHKESEWVEYAIEGDEFCTRVSEKDSKLISYLAKHNHFTPFTHCMATFRIKVPFFVAAQIKKHQVGFTVNEVSRRYVSESPEFYFPDIWRKKAENVKQGSSDIPVDLSSDLSNYDDYYSPESVTEFCATAYEKMLQAGVAEEQARMVLPLNTMTEFWMTGSLYGWARLVKLRTDTHSQKETRDVALLLSQEMSKLFSVSWSALVQIN